MAEGRDQGAFVLTSSADDEVDFLLAALGGVMIPRVLHPGPSAESFRQVLLTHMRLALGLSK